MDELYEDFLLHLVEAAEGNLNNLQLDGHGGRECPLKFVLQILKVVVLGGCILEGGLKAVDSNLAFDAERG